MNIKDFVTESNRIEGINRAPTKAELNAHAYFVDLPAVFAQDLIIFVNVYQPNAVLRDKPGLNVRVGSHRPPKGGPGIAKALDKLLAEANESTDPYSIHVAYETLHPFTDCNGRSGRVLWYWMMQKLHGGASLGFLHHFYYQASNGARK